MRFEGDHTWQLATVWTRSHRVFINCIAAPYISHMGFNSQDLESEALLAAYQTVSTLVKSNKCLTLMDRYFRVIFRSRCVDLALGVGVISGCDVERINVAQSQEKLLHQELDQAVIDEAFMSLTERQRQVAKWIISQPTPVDTDLIGQQFGITKRGVRRLINNAICRIENGHRRVYKTVPANP